MPLRTLYLVRHGQHDRANLDGHPLGGTLTGKGFQQAQLLSHRMTHFPITAIHASSLRRAFQTARVVAEKLPEVLFRKTKALWECIPGLPEKPPREFDHYSPQMLVEGEARAESVFHRYFKSARRDDKYELLVCHGNLIRYLVCRVLDAPSKHWNRLEIANCSVSEVRIKPDGRPSLLTFNDQSHLPDHLRSFL